MRDERTLEEVAAAAPPTAMPTPGGIERMVIQTADGREYDLGRPGTVGFRFRRRMYMIKRRKELRNG